MDDPELTAIVDYETGKCACVLLQAVFGGDSRVANIFPVERWELAPKKTFLPVRAPRSWWRMVSETPQEALAQHLADLAGAGLQAEEKELP